MMDNVKLYMLCYNNKCNIIYNGLIDSVEINNKEIFEKFTNKKNGSSTYLPNMYEFRAINIHINNSPGELYFNLYSAKMLTYSIFMYDEYIYNNIINFQSYINTIAYRSKIENYDEDDEDDEDYSCILDNSVIIEECDHSKIELKLEKTFSFKLVDDYYDDLDSYIACKLLEKI